MHNLNKAKRDRGTIPVRFLKIIVAGSGATGKTNFINLLMKKKFKKNHHSTNVVHANHAVSFRMASFQESSENDEVTWVELDSELEIGYTFNLYCFLKLYRGKNYLQEQLRELLLQHHQAQLKHPLNHNTNQNHLGNNNLVF